MNVSLSESAGPAQLDALFGALADPTRRAILARLAQGEATVSELAEPHQLTQPTISKHLKVLESAGLISTARDAQRRPRRLEAGALAAADGWFEPFRKLWERRYRALDRVLDELSPDEPPRPQKKAKARRSKP
jgi:DNA-binding transcriptional ArsR family regulator